MKKIFLILTILLSAVICSACINNLAIQELNNKAKDYIANGEPEKAVCRLKSSLDLDSNFFETNYNLAIAYIELKDYDDAKSALEQAIKLNPDFADSYYSLGVVYENLGDSKINDEQNEKVEIDDDKINVKEYELPQETKQEIVNYYTKAIEAYNTYVTKSDDTESKKEVQKIIENLTEEIDKYTTKGNQE